MKVCMICVAVMLGGCATYGEPYPAEFKYTDDPVARRIELTYTNHTDKPTCFAQNMWPNAAGKLHFSSDSVFLVIDDQRFPIEDFNTGYCTEPCGTVVGPGETTTAFLRYQDFSVPSELRRRPKELVFQPMTFRCN